MKVVETYEDKRHFYVISELLEGKELFDEIVDRRNFGEKDAAALMKQILSAVNYCHQNQIVHR
jgi:calcium-dependent protein kinase